MALGKGGAYHLQLIFATSRIKGVVHEINTAQARNSSYIYQVRLYGKLVWIDWEVHLTVFDATGKVYS